MSGLSTAAMAVAATALQTAGAFGQIHSAPAGPNGTLNVAAPARQLVPWAPPAGLGNFGLIPPLMFTGGTPRGPVYSITLWTALIGGLFGGEFQITTGDMTFDNAGMYLVNAFNETGTAA
jgi:hypothetical protein